MEGHDRAVDGQPDNAGDEGHRRGHETQIGERGFNWRFPLLGAVGFGLGFAIVCAIDATIYDITKNFFADAFPGTRVGPEVGLIRGIIAGATGGFVLGLASKDRTYFLRLSLAGGAGFGLAFALAIGLSPSIGYLVGPEPFAGGLVGGIGGLAMGLASAKGKIAASLLLCGAGAICFACAFAFRAAIFDGNLCSAWNLFGGAVGGGVLGLTLAAHHLSSNRPH